MRQSGLILSSLFLFVVLSSFAFAGPCDFNDSTAYLDTWTIPFGDTCFFSTEILDTFDVSGLSGRVTSIIVDGSLILNNVTLLMSFETNTTITVTGSFETYNGSHISAVDCAISPCEYGNISFYFDGDVILDTTTISNAEVLRSDRRLTMNKVSILDSYIALFASENVTANDASFDCISTGCVVIDDGVDVSIENFTIRSPDVPLFIKDSLGVVLSDFEISSFGSINNGSADIKDSVVTLDSGLFTKIDLSIYDSNVSFIDIDASKVKTISVSLIYQYWSVLFRITKEVDVPQRLAFVDVSNIEGFYSSLYSDFFGEAYVPLLSSVENLSAIKYYSNYSINITKSQYQGVNYSINATRAYVLDLNMSSAKGIIKVGGACVLPASFCAVENPVPPCRNMRAGEFCAFSFTVNATDNSGDLLHGLINTSHDFFAIVESNIPSVGGTESKILEITVVE
jgi:hypothetical protein